MTQGGSRPGDYLVKFHNLSDLTDTSVARINLGLGGVESEIADKLPLSGGVLTGPLAINATESVGIYPLGIVGAEDTGLNLLSSFEGGEDEGQVGQYDSTARLNLYSYQRADVGSYGEVMRVFAMRADSKQMTAYYFPQSGYDAVTREPVGTFKPAVWFGAHWEANDHGSNHKHWSLETPDATGALQTRLEIRFGNPATTGSIGGLDKTLIATNQADFVVRTSNGQELRLSSPAGNAKPITFSLDYEGGDASRRWQLRATSEAESGANAGSNFQLARYDDTGTFVDTPVVVSRSTGNVTITPGFIARRATSTVSSLSLNTTSLGGGLGVIALSNANTAPASTPSGGGVLYAEAGALKYKGSSGTITTLGVA